MSYLDELNLKTLQRKAKCDHQIRAVEQMAGFKLEHGEAELKVTDFSEGSEWVTKVIEWVKAQHG